MPIGIVKRVPNVRNYGFVIVGEGSSREEVFFHRSDVADDGFDQLEDGKRVNFEIGRDPRDTTKRRAVNVTPAES